MLLFNRYQYEPADDLIGKGEFTEVYEALDTHIYLPVAVKIYRAIETTEKFGFVQVDKFCGLDHPNICRYLHVGEIRTVSASGEKEKRQVCITELLKDGDFASYYQAHRQPELLRRMVLDILHGLTYLHSQRIVHRRLKPSNLLVGMTVRGPVVKITDFGLGSGKATSRDARFSSMIMEVTRMAPEQFNPKEYGIDGNVSYHIDFWSLGLAVYEALTDGDDLFKYNSSDSREQVIKNILSPRLPEKVLRLPAPFDRFLTRCLAKHADQRPQNTRELIELLSQPIPNVIEGQPVQPVESVQPTRVVENVQREKPLIVVIPPHEEERGAARSAENRMTDSLLEPAAEPVAVLAKPVRTKEVHPFFRRYEYNPEQSLIGKGGFSRVYKAFDKKLDRWVALKFYKTADHNEKYSPIAEIRRVINLDHPNICRYLDIEEIEKENAFGERESTQVSVMELLDGGNLREYYSAYPTKEVLRKLVGDVLQGLAYLHRNGIIHRDIKPANILIRKTNDGPVAKITDFGVSKLSSTDHTNSQSALVVSIPYMAPEQLNVRKYGVEEAIGFNLDLWAVGVTVYEIITGKVLFRNKDNDSNEEIMANILAPGLQDRIAELPQPFLDIVRRCLVRDARRRVQRADELIELLNRPEPVEEVPAARVEPTKAEPAASFEARAQSREAAGRSVAGREVAGRKTPGRKTADQHGANREAGVGKGLGQEAEAKYETAGKNGAGQKTEARPETGQNGTNQKTEVKQEAVVGNVTGYEAAVGKGLGREAEAKRETAGQNGAGQEAEARPEAGQNGEGQEAEERREMKIPPELRLIPEPAVNTQDVFVPEKSWVWAEAVSAPEMEEPVPVVVTKTSRMISSGGFRIAIIAAMVAVLLTSYIIIQNNRYAAALRVMPPAAQTTEAVKAPEKLPVVDKTPAPAQHHRARPRQLNRRIR